MSYAIHCDHCDKTLDWKRTYDAMRSPSTAPGHIELHSRSVVSLNTQSWAFCRLGLRREVGTQQGPDMA